MRKLLFTFVLSLLPLSFADAKMFKCVENGRVTYQATPCKGGGGEINVLPPDEVTPSQGDANKPRETAAKFDEQSRAFMLEQRLRDVEFEIGNLESKLAAYQADMKTELDELQKRKEFWQRAEGGKLRAQGVDEEIKSATEKYQAKIKEAQDELSKLSQEKTSLKAQLPQK